MSHWQIQGTQYPTYVIDLGQLTDFLEITNIMKTLKITNYVYSFIYQQQVIKHGISADNSLTWGERIYRQAGHLEGWNRKLAPYSSGSDMQEISDLYYNKTGNFLNRIGMIITVVDLTAVQSPISSDPAYPCKKMESDLIKEHIEATGSAPIGNKRTEQSRTAKGIVTDAKFSELFEAPDES
jgi:hypothetical protein